MGLQDNVTVTSHSDSTSTCPITNKYTSVYMGLQDNVTVTSYSDTA
jgi:hypothetical protein